MNALPRSPDIGNAAPIRVMIRGRESYSRFDMRNTESTEPWEPRGQATCADDVMDNMPLFRSGLGGSNPTSALHLKIRECGMRRAQELNRAWHSVLPETHLGNLVGNNRNVAYEAEVNEVSYAVAIWTTPIAANRLTDGWLILELRRMAISDKAPRNTASRMLAVMTRLIKKRWPELKRLVSYQAEKHHRGTIYRAAGWHPVATSEAQTWHEGESRAVMQTDSAKVRWELELRPRIETDECEVSREHEVEGSLANFDRYIAGDR